MLFKKSLFAAAVLGVAAFATHTAANEKHGKHEVKAEVVMAGDLHIAQPWTRAMLPGQKVGGGFLVISNKGAADDRLVSATSPATDRVEIHEMAVVDDVMRMRALQDGLVIPAGETTELKPGGYHIMFMEVEEGFAEGDMIPVVLTFEKAGNVELMFHAMPVGSKKMDHGKMHHGEKTN